MTTMTRTTTLAEPGDPTACGMAGCDQVAIMNKDGSRVCTKCVMRRMNQLVIADRRRIVRSGIKTLKTKLNEWRFDPLMGI